MTDKAITMVGLDTSHTVAFTKLIQNPEDKIVDGMRVTRALRFPSVFQPEDGQDARQAELEAMGVSMAATIEDAVEAAALEEKRVAMKLSSAAGSHKSHRSDRSRSVKMGGHVAKDSAAIEREFDELLADAQVFVQ